MTTYDQRTVQERQAAQNAARANQGIRRKKAPMSTKHSPTPWTVVHGLDGTYIEAPPEPLGKVMCRHTVARCDYGTVVRYRENAAHAVRCVDAHDALVAALEALTDYGDERPQINADCMAPLHEIICKARAALASVATNPARGKKA